MNFTLETVLYYIYDTNSSKINKNYPETNNKINSGLQYITIVIFIWII